MSDVELAFSENLAAFVRPDLRAQNLVRRIPEEKRAVKDIIEACGVPHTEVDLIVASTGNRDDPRAVDFDWPVQTSVRLEIFGVPAPAHLLPQAPRLQVRHFSRFVADGHLGKLARNLRLLGLDTEYEQDADDRRLLGIMGAENRALLTRDRRLLMHSIVRHGYCPRTGEPEQQTREVLFRFGLGADSGHLAPYTRCLRCNALLQPVSKSAVVDLLSDEPLTLRYYHEFRRCTGCGRVYWAGTHFGKLAARLDRLTDLTGDQRGS